MDLSGWGDPASGAVGKRELQRGVADPVGEIVAQHRDRIGGRQDEHAARQTLDVWTHRDRPPDAADDRTGGDEREVQGDDE